MVLPETSADAACEIAERLRTRIEALPFVVNNRAIGLTASFGVASLNGAHDSIAELIGRCDDALYAAKRNGRNSVMSNLCAPSRA